MEGTTILFLFHEYIIHHFASTIKLDEGGGGCIWGFPSRYSNGYGDITRSGDFKIPDTGKYPISKQKFLLPSKFSNKRYGIGISHVFHSTFREIEACRRLNEEN